MFLGEGLLNFESFNYAYMAYGPQQVLALLETDRLEKEVYSDSGYSFYLYYHFHKDRLLANSAYYNWFDKRTPIDRMSNSEISNFGMDTEVAEKRTKLLKFFGKLNIVNYFRVKMPAPESQESDLLMCSAVKKMKKLFELKKLRAKFRQTWPSYPEEGVHSVSVDRHMNARAHKFVSEVLISWVKEGSDNSFVVPADKKTGDYR